MIFKNERLVIYPEYDSVERFVNGTLNVILSRIPCTT